MDSIAKIAVVGAGLGGLCAAIKLREAGFEDVTVFERAEAVGGTWRDNTYPGCACDVPVSVYQFSFAPSLDWSHIYPRQKEIHRYSEFLADAFGLRPHLRLGVGVEAAAWQEDEGLWRLSLTDGSVFEAGVLVAALGQLNRPALPDIAGREDFAGAAFHSARWDHEVATSGRRIGVIGSAASAVQIVPEIARTAARVSVFQRTPNWVIPRYDRRITEEDKALLMTAPEVAALAREQVYQSADHFFWQAFAWTEEGRAAYTRQALNHLEAQIPDAELRRRLTPDYPIGCKRVLISDDFYPSLLRGNVELVTDGIDSITASGVRTVDGTARDFDVLVYATGFETTGWHWSMDVAGRNGHRLREDWKDGPEAYYGITVADYPNLFMLYGPNTNLGHNSITFMIERQVEYTVAALAHLREQGLAAMTVRRDAQARFNAELQKGLARTVWADPGCSSWYKNADGRITQNWHSHTRDYAAAVKDVRWQDYELLAG